MNNRLEKLDMILASLEKIEPLPAFDVEFKKRLGRAIARRFEEKPIGRILRTIREGAYNLRDALIPEPLVLVRIAVTFIVVISVGLYIYSSQPSLPGVIASEGFVVVKGAQDTSFKEIGPSYKFRAGDTISASKGARIDIGLSDRYVMRLKEGSSLKIAKLTPRYGKGIADFRLIEGKVLVSVEPGFKGSKFIVDTETATAIALGTKFSVDAAGDERPRTEISVLQGRVKVEARYRPERILVARQFVTVGPGQKTDVYTDTIPTPPQRLVEEEWSQLEELYQIGKKPQVTLLVKNTPDRVRELLKPCPIYITDEKPREVPKLLDEALLKTAEAVRSNDTAKHLESVKLLERIVMEHPNPKCDVQFMLYIGAYYEYLGYHQDAIDTFRSVILKYPDSPLASMAQAAIGIIYEEKLGDEKKASEAYQQVLQKYPDSLEAIWVEENSKSIKKLDITH